MHYFSLAIILSHRIWFPSPAVDINRTFYVDVPLNTCQSVNKLDCEMLCFAVTHLTWFSYTYLTSALHVDTAVLLVYGI